MDILLKVTVSILTPQPWKREVFIYVISTKRVHKSNIEFRCLDDFIYSKFIKTIFQNSATLTAHRSVFSWLYCGHFLFNSLFQYIIYTQICKKKIKCQVKPVKPGDRFTKVIVNRKSKITLKISLRARIRAFH